jgi:hypothetical protein
MKAIQEKPMCINGLVKHLGRFLLCVSFLSLASITSASELREITLDDGSYIVGEIISVENGSYTIKTKSLGTLTLGSRQVKSVTRLGGSTGSPAATATADMKGASTNSISSGSVASSVQQIQSSITSNTSLMSAIMQMQSNPEMQAVLSDPALMQAIQSFDIEEIQNHPKIIRLMQSQEMQQIQSNVN